MTLRRDGRQLPACTKTPLAELLLGLARATSAGLQLPPLGDCGTTVWGHGSFTSRDVGSPLLHNKKACLVQSPPAITSTAATFSVLLIRHKKKMSSNNCIHVPLADGFAVSRTLERWCFGACRPWAETLSSISFLFMPPRSINPCCNEAEQPLKLTVKLINNLQKSQTQGTAANNTTELRKSFRRYQCQELEST